MAAAPHPALPMLRWLFGRSSFAFIDPGPLVDGDLELTAPSDALIPALVDSATHPQTVAEAPDLARVTRQSALQFLHLAPAGRQSAATAANGVPSYHFWMRLTPADAPLSIAGGISLRIGDAADLRFYTGHVGYHVYPAARGRHLAERATRLLLPLARRHGLRTLWITANPDNAPSRRTCSRLGGRYVDTVPVPPTHPLYVRGEHLKCRYELQL